MRKSLINICGAPRSGSTMVDLMIGNDPHAFSLGEVNAWFRPFRTHHFAIVCSCGQTGCPWEKLKFFKEHEFYKKCFELLDVDTLVDSSKDLPWIIDNNERAKDYDFNVHNVLLFKEPISFFYSFWKRGGSLKKAKQKFFIQYYKRFFQTGLPFISLSYDRLVSAPSATLKQLCDLLEIPYFPGKERFWEKDHHHLFGSIGTRKQVAASASKVRKHEDYPADFKQIIPNIKVDIENDVTFQTILSKLQANELNNHSSLQETTVSRPHWYYIVKAKQRLRKKFPKKWPYSQ